MKKAEQEHSPACSLSDWQLLSQHLHLQQQTSFHAFWYSSDCSGFLYSHDHLDCNLTRAAWPHPELGASSKPWKAAWHETSAAQLRCEQAFAALTKTLKQIANLRSVACPCLGREVEKMLPACCSSGIRFPFSSFDH